MPTGENWRERLFEFASDIIMVVDFDGNIVDVNPAVEQVLGISPEEFRRAGHRSFVHPDDLDATLKAAAHVRAGNETINFENRYRAADGNFRHLSWAVFPDMESRVSFSIGRDITEQKHDQATERQITTHIEQEEKIASLQTMASAVAHDFNNAFAAVLGYLNLIRIKTKGETPVEHELEEIKRYTEQASSLASQLFSYAGRRWETKERVALNALLHDMKYELEFTKSDNIDLTIEYGEDLPEIEADPNQLRQIVLNLLVNAVEAFHGQPGSVSIRTGSVSAAAQFWRRQGSGDGAPSRYLTITVTDDGPGIAGEVMRRMFDPFFTTKPVSRGLGLAQVQGTARAHGGAVMVESEPGDGAAFTVLFPAAGEATDTVGVAETEAGGAVLVVDDEKSICEIVAYTLTSAGYQVHVAKNGQDAIEVFDRVGGVIDLALIDYRMPYMNGAETANRLREKKPGLPVVLSSGYPSDVLPEAFLAQPRTTFLQKPYPPAELVMLVGRMLAEARKGDEA
jgi:two-component system, cell cycle sensor histidine kinase and response regulator CckA